MNEKELRAAVERVILSELAKIGEPYVPVTSSNRHCHLCQADVERLFGAGYRLTKLRDLVQPGQFACNERVTIETEKGKTTLRVVGPARDRTQVELSLTDAIKLGLRPPIRMSGELEGSPGGVLSSGNARITLSSGVIVAARHLHMSPEEAQAFDLRDGDVVSLRVEGPRPATLDGFIVRSGAAHRLEAHIDTDEANACALRDGQLCRVIRREGADVCAPGNTALAAALGGMLLGGMYSGCPLNNLIPEWNDLVYQGKWDLAVHRLIATNRYPEFTSRVCPALCEAACTCGMATGDPVTVKENERAIVEYGYESGVIHAVPPPARTGKTVAVIGAGPAGLSVADLLNKRGHKVTIYEREDRPGGLLMYGIPNMKLEKWVIDRRVKILQDEGIEFVFNADVGNTVSAEELKARYDAVVLCCGAKQARDIQAPGRDAQGIFFAVDYLTSVTRSLLDSNFADGKAVSAAGKRVLVIGGGDTGNDCVGTAIRQGCESVMQLEMMPCPPAARAPGNDWPEWPRVLKTDYGQQEAIAKFGFDPRVYQTTVKEFYKNEAGQVCGALISKLKSEVVDGRRQMVPTGEEFTVDCDLVLIAAGFTGCEPYVADAFGVERTKRGTVADVKYATADPKVFACGDMRRGQSLVVWALREGRDTAAVVDEKLMGYTNL